MDQTSVAQLCMARGTVVVVGGCHTAQRAVGAVEGATVQVVEVLERGERFGELAGSCGRLRTCMGLLLGAVAGLSRGIGGVPVKERDFVAVVDTTGFAG